MRTHIGVDAKSGLVHTIKTTTAKVHDARMTDDLIRTDDAAVFGDKGYVSDKRKRASRADGVLWAVKDKRKPGRVLSASQKKRNRKHGSVRAKVEHIFRVIKCQFGYRKARYRGLGLVLRVVARPRRDLGEAERLQLAPTVVSSSEMANVSKSHRARSCAAKNAAQMFSLMALANLYLARQCLRAESV